MLKQSVSYVDFNGTPSVDTLYFNLSKTEILDFHDELIPRLENWQAQVGQAERSLTEAEIREMLDIVKFLVQKSYGVRSADGKRFTKSDELFQEFKESAAYDEFFFGLFEQPQRAVDFITGILPKDALEQVKATQAELPSGPQEVPAWEAEGREPTAQEMQSMTREQLLEVYKRKSQG